MLKKLFLILFVTCAAASFFVIDSLADASKQPQVSFFYSLSCHDCMRIKNEIMPSIEDKFKGEIDFVYKEIGDIENYKLLLALKKERGSAEKISVPEIYFKGRFLSGKAISAADIEKHIASLKSLKASEETAADIDLINRFKGFSLFAVAAAGAVDGINPCAFTVIVFFISYLALQGFNKKELVLIGASFILSVFLTYIIIGLGLFGFLYKIRGFYLVVKAFNIIVGVFSIALGVVSLYDFFKFRKNRDSQELILKLPDRIKHKIHSVIGSQYRGKKSLSDGGSSAPFFKLIAGAFTTGFLVSILEAVCTGQVYLPTIAYVLKTEEMKLRAVFYLLFYNLMFILPLIAVFLFSLAGTSSAQFGQILKRNIPGIKIAMALLFFALGIFLILR